MLGVTMTGEKLEPYSIFKSTSKTKKNSRAAKELSQLPFPTDIEYGTQSKAWMDEECMIEWVNKVWRPWTETKIGPTYLIMDEFVAHMSASVKKAINE